MKAKLNDKQKKFVAEYVKTTNATKSAAVSHNLDNPKSAAVQGSRMLRDANIRQAIDAALEAHGATPEFAVGRLKAIAEQDKEIGASRLAAKDILELHGWQRGDRPTLTLNVKQAFFKRSRATNPIDIEPN